MILLVTFAFFYDKIKKKEIFIYLNINVRFAVIFIMKKKVIQMVMCLLVPNGKMYPRNSVVRVAWPIKMLLKK